jgi:hypothetical protein
MQLEPPVPLSSYDGGTEMFFDGFDEAQVAAGIAQGRLQEYLDTIGPPGSWACDPQKGTLTMRGKTFAAQMLGSWGRTEWLWSWANPFLNIPFEKTSIARAMRDEQREELVDGMDAFTIPFVDFEGAATPHHIAMQVIARGHADAYYVCQFPESQSVYAIEHGQIVPQWPKLYELQRAITNAMAGEGLHAGVRAIEQGARFLGLTPDRTADRMVVHDGDDVLVVQLDGDAITKINADVKL